MADQYNFGQLTKEMVTQQVKGSPNAPQAAAEIAKKTIISGIHSTRSLGQSPKETLEEICFGAMSGVLLAECNLPQTAVLILRGMTEVAAELNLDPSELMTWAMAGIARITAVSQPQTIYDIRAAIETEYHGAGEVFSQLCAPFAKT